MEDETAESNWYELTTTPIPHPCSSRGGGKARNEVEEGYEGESLFLFLCFYLTLQHY